MRQEVFIKEDKTPSAFNISANKDESCPKFIMQQVQESASFLDELQS